MNIEQHNEIMGNLISKLLMAQKAAHVHHWKTKSFSQHLALGELYELLTDMADEIAEMYMGQYGTEMHIDQSEPNGFDEHDVIGFIRLLNTFLADQHDRIPPEPWLVNKFEELQGKVVQIKYKLENLS